VPISSVSGTLKETKVADPHSFHPDPDPAFQTEYRSGYGSGSIQDFNDQKLKKIQLKKY
jgi:hypothetical protein